MNLPSLAATRSERGIQLRFKREKIMCCKDNCIGGKKYRYLALTLPKAIQQDIITHELKRDGSLALTVQSHFPVIANSKKAVKNNLNQAQIKKCLAKADLTHLFTDWMAAAPWGKKPQARNDFMLAYTSGAWPKLLELLGTKISWQAIDRWGRTITKNNGDCFALADRRGYVKKGKTSITPTQAKILLSCLLHPNQPRISEAVRMAEVVMRARHIGNNHSEAAYRRWIEQWKSRNYHIWVFNRQGAKAWNDKCAKDIMRDYSLINVGDIVVADGHILNWQTTNPYTGKPCRMMLVLWFDMKSNYPLGWEVMPTEDTATISSALRHAIIRLGRIPKVAYLDNGRAFRSKYFEGCPSFEESGLSSLYERLGMKTIHAWPYHGQSKVIERFFGTFAELERWCPTYTGTSIEHKPARMMRGEKLHRQVHAHTFGGHILTLEQAHQAIAYWFDEYVGRPQKGHLAGATPQEIFDAERGDGVIDGQELQLLMMEMEIKTIDKNGISFRKQKFYHPALYGRRHPVVIRYDLQDNSYVDVYEEDGTFICRATPPELVHPAAQALGDDTHVAELQKQIEFKRHQEKEASTTAREFLEAEIMPAHQARMERLGIGCHAAGEDSNIIALPAPAKRLQAPKRGMTKAEAAAAMAEAEEMIAAQEDFETADLRKRLAQMAEPERYEELIEMQVKNDVRWQEYKGFIDYFESTAYYRQYEHHYDDLRARASIMYQMSM